MRRARLASSDPRSTGDIISRLGSDASIVGDSVTRELGEGLRALLTTAIGLGLMCYISLRLTAVMCLIVPPSAVAAVLYGRYIRKLSKKTQKVRRCALAAPLTRRPSAS